MDVMKWKKYKFLGKGTYGTVTLAVRLDRTATPVAVKSAVIEKAQSLKMEGIILSELRGCPGVVQCFGDDLSIENGYDIYNLLLECASGGTLGNLIETNGGRIPEAELRRYIYMLLKGLYYTHKEGGLVHCDIKPSNILVFPTKLNGVTMNNVKLADFGLAKKAGDGIGQFNGRLDNFRGTPLYASPESVLLGQHEPPTDIWSLGCTIIEMVSGKPVWRFRNMHDLLYQIAWVDLVPRIPQDMSEKGKDFLRRCLAREPGQRWTAEMLLNHPFIAGNDTPDELIMPSHDNPFGYNSWFGGLDLFTNGKP